MRAWFDSIRRGALIVFRHEVVHELRSPTENEIALTLTLSHRNGRGNFFAVRGLVTGPAPYFKRAHEEHAIREKHCYSPFHCFVNFVSFVVSGQFRMTTTTVRR